MVLTTEVFMECIVRGKGLVTDGSLILLFEV